MEKVGTMYMQRFKAAQDLAMAIDRLEKNDGGSLCLDRGGDPMQHRQMWCP